MEEYNFQVNENANSRGGGFYGGGPVLAPSSSMYARTRTSGSGGGFHLMGDGYDEGQQVAVVKTEGGSSRFQYPSMISDNNGDQRHHHQHLRQQQRQREEDEYRTESESNIVIGGERDGEVDAIKAKIIAHPHYSNLLEAYMDCQKVGAPAEVVARLTAVREEFAARQRATARRDQYSKDPELDQFMEAYYDMLIKYREELTRPLQEAMDFMRRIESQLNLLTNSPPLRTTFNSNSEDKSECIGSSEEDQDNNSGGETGGVPEIDPRAEDRELKNHLLKKYSGYLSSLKQELSKKKKKGKLPKEARQKLLSWWELHYKWPYPSESEKVALAESTGLDQKQINNWFINQRKRHWKPSEDMQFMVMDGLHPQNAALYMETNHYMGDGPYRLGP